MPQADLKDLWRTITSPGGEFLRFHQDKQGAARPRPAPQPRTQDGALRGGRGARAEPVGDRGFPPFAEAPRRVARDGARGQRVTKRRRSGSVSGPRRAASTSCTRPISEAIRAEQVRNLELPRPACAARRLEALVQQSQASRRDWNKAGDRLLEIQKTWKNDRFRPAQGQQPHLRAVPCMRRATASSRRSARSMPA